MSTIMLVFALVLMLSATLLLRSPKQAWSHRLLMTVCYGASTACFCIIYGNIGGVFTALACAFLLGLCVAFVCGRAEQKKA